MKRIKVSAVSFLNTRPFLWGMEKSGLLQDIDLVLDIPSVCGSKLMNNEVDLALAPIAIMPKMAFSELITDFCIGCDGAVQTVGLYANQAINEISKVQLDAQSKTSNVLARMLIEKYWKLEVEFIPGELRKHHFVQKGEAILVIGDGPFKTKNQFQYFYDLGEAWKSFTGLPFVFAAWIANTKLPDNFKAALNEALKKGLAFIPQIAIQEQGSYEDRFDVGEYLSKSISYKLDDTKKESMQIFFNHLQLIHQ